ncbi:SGNH/GDSL hydrolase family protein [Mucilaginibacter paludis]|uniref:Lipolytic protein G-D-S-L family n=1 Tax=Mucilaginibacter paludis DSM 18603 TaxID=714943 RepID=H1Y557_9SPHI|nr:SGNH/GDSL hydrolase family protein [Mucilaginibacter paludis]EHQ28600.1 lipolytic protein G-D-S-L family [Mucilaginibacter paludis DSM 18603]
MFSKFSRRNFITSSAIAAVGSLALPEIVSAAATVAGVKKIGLNKDDVILFQGDSITDWGRNHNEVPPNTSSALGNAYPFAIATTLLTQYPGKSLKFYNKGVSGNKVYQLAERWDAECLALKPNVLSILVGVNDFWHKLNGAYAGTIDTYRNDYKALIDRTKQALPDVKLIIGEPFALTGVKYVNQNWYPKFNEFRLVAREVADTYHATFIPYQSIFDDALKLAPAAYWSLDGVHPTVAGSGLMARVWLETVKG